MLADTRAVVGYIRKYRANQSPCIIDADADGLTGQAGAARGKTTFNIYIFDRESTEIIVAFRKPTEMIVS